MLFVGLMQQMKKGISILLLAVYSLSSSGIGLKEVYCCGRLISVSIEIMPGRHHPASGDKNSSNCCNSCYRFFQLKENYLADEITPLFARQSTEIHTAALAFQSLSDSRRPVSMRNHLNAPSAHTGVPVYIYNCVYRI